jgi:hypothetical protein
VDRDTRRTSAAVAKRPDAGSRLIALQASIGNRAMSRLLTRDLHALSTTRAPASALQRNGRYQMDVSGNQFGETYHIALAMIFAKLRGDRVILPKWLMANTVGEGQTPANDSQKAFLTKVFRFLNQYDLADIESIGQPDPKSEALSHNVGSTQVGKMIEDVELWKNTDLLESFANQTTTMAKALAFLRAIFLSAPDINALVGGQFRAQGHATTQKRAIETQIRRDLDRLFNVNSADPNAAQARRAHQRYVIFNRQQAGSEERNLTDDLVQCIVDDARGCGVTQFLVNTSTKDAFPRAYGTEFVNIGPVVQGAVLPAGVDPRTYQLNVMNLLHREYGVVRVVGMKSGAMDGPAMIGIPTIYFDTYDTGRLTFITPHLPTLRRVDISKLGNRPPDNKRKKAEWKVQVMQNILQARS